MCIEVKKRNVIEFLDVRLDRRNRNRMFTTKCHNELLHLKESPHSSVSDIESLLVNSFPKREGLKSRDAFLKAEFPIKLLIVELDLVRGAQNRLRTIPGPSSITGRVFVRRWDNGNLRVLQVRVFVLNAEKVLLDAESLQEGQ